MFHFRYTTKEIREINLPQSKTIILLIPANEEIEIANQVYDLLSIKLMGLYLRVFLILRLIYYFKLPTISSGFTQASKSSAVT